MLVLKAVLANDVSAMMETFYIWVVEFSDHQSHAAIETERLDLQFNFN